MIKLIAVDMDGTLLDNDHTIHKENIIAINKAEEMGIKVVICTGREYSSVVNLLEECDLECQCILMNGAQYRDERGEILESINIDNSKVKDIVDILNKFDMNAELFTNDGMYSINSKEKTFEGLAHRVMHFDNLDNIEDARKAVENYPFAKNIKYVDDLDAFLKSNIKINKIIAFYHYEDVIAKAKVETEALGDLAVSSSFRDNIEITDKSAQKGLILEKVSKEMGMKKDEVAVFGDSFNDYSMFTEFTESYAMGNAIDEVKEIAKYITDTNDNAGVAKGIYKIIEENKQN